jgi:hypothetical protein
VFGSAVIIVATPGVTPSFALIVQLVINNTAKTGKNNLNDFIRYIFLFV